MSHRTPSRTDLPPPWREWIVDNLARGCDSHALIAEMVSAHFEAGFASRTVYALAKRPAVPMPPPEPYVYERPRLASGSLIVAMDRRVHVRMRLERPVLAVLDGVLDPNECTELMRRCVDRLQPSTIVDVRSGAHERVPTRSSEGTFFPRDADPFIARLQRRIAAVMHCPIENAEALQILRYRTGEQYTPHYDYFPPNEPGSAATLAAGGQRVSSLVIYLNDVEAGGATVFPKLHLSVTPQRGSAVYFEYCNSRGQLDRRTLHAGAPVLRGEKWIATQWMRERDPAAP